MLPYNLPPILVHTHQGKKIASFVTGVDENMDTQTVAAFGQEWEAFHAFSEEEIQHIGKEYFDITDERHFNSSSLVLDVGCGSGRWSKYLADKVKFIEAIDPSEAVFSAVNQTQDLSNVRITRAGVDRIPFDDNAFDFVFSLGVLHHIPDTLRAMQACVEKLRPGGYFLVYLYYALDNRGTLFRALFRTVNLLRKLISRLPYSAKRIICDLLAFFIYLPLALLSKTLKAWLKDDHYKRIPLSYYHDKSFYVMRNDALDRFGTPLEQRFTRKQIYDMMVACGMEEIVFSEHPPFWHALGKKKNQG